MKGRSIHPPREELIKFAIRDYGDSKDPGEIADHVRSCTFCREICDNYLLLLETNEPYEREKIPRKLIRLADDLYDAAMRSNIISLAPMISDASRKIASCLAADGKSKRQQKVQNVATLYSEDPDVVLRIMHTLDPDSHYLQLAAEEDRLAKNVMVQVPELGKEFVTDDEGRAEIDLQTTANIDRLKWQIKLPEAVFALEPLAYDPEDVEYSKEISLKTERHDLIKVRFEGKTEGKLLSIRVVELDGRSDFGPIKIAVTQQHRTELETVKPGEPIRFGPVDADTTINIRLYQ